MHLMSQHEDLHEIDELVRAFFSLFTNRGGITPNLAAIFELCLADAVIAKCVSPEPEVMTLSEFVAPRQTILTNGTLVNFEEVETSSQTRVLGRVAQRWCTYAKSGVLSGAAFETRGAKVFQFVKSPAGWRISAMAWDDEREGFQLDASLNTHQRPPLLPTME